jgi:hypothetical protein
MPTFTHEELMQLFNAIAAHVENHDGEDVPAAAETASDKLSAYVAALGAK